MNDQDKEKYIKKHIAILKKCADVFEDANYDVECTITSDISKLLKNNKHETLENILHQILIYLENIGEGL